MVSERNAIFENKGVRFIADAGEGLCIARAEIKFLREQDINAHIMNPTMFRQLAENIKKRNALESLPFCAVVKDHIEIVSGHHRVKAAREAGLTEILILLDTSGLSRSAIVAKQLAHNFINGYDDKKLIDELSKMITDVDDMIESYLQNAEIEAQDVEIGKVETPAMDLEWREMSFVFLPEQFSKFDELVKSCGSKDFLGVALRKQYEEFIDVLWKYQKYQDIRSVGMAIDLLTKKAKAELEGAEYTDESEWQNIQSCIGGGSIPKECADTIKKAVKKMVDDGIVDAHKKWQSVYYLCDRYLNGNRGE